MSQRSLKFCNHHNCSTLIPTGTYCDTHAPLHVVNRDCGRGTSTERGYDGRWRMARDAYLKRHPLCERCLAMDRVEPATMVHHIKALRDGGERLDPENMMSCSRTCHEIIEGRLIEAKEF